MNLSRLAPVAVAVAAALAGGAAGAANLVTNGSFEAPNVVGGGIYVLYNTGSSAITGWTVLGPGPSDSVQLTPDTYLGLKASDGHQWMDLTGIYGYDKGLRSASIATELGATYHLSFDVGNYLPFGKSTIGLALNGGSETWYTNTSLAATATAPMNWMSFGFDWVADSSSLTLSFLGRANAALSNNAGIGLDNVSVNLVSAPVPEPGVWVLMVAGLGFVASMARWRRGG